MKRISILGSTGSIGLQTIEVVRNNPEMFQIDALSARSSLDTLIEQIIEFRPKEVCIFEEKHEKTLKSRLKELGLDDSIEVSSGIEGLVKISEIDATDILVTSVVGMIGLLPTLKALEKGKTIALANKETLVTAGHLVMEYLKKYSGQIIPVDSEHSAIFQCLVGEKEYSVGKLILTASGGPFRGMQKSDVAKMTRIQALKHPNWSMGQKITIDSATLMNKGLEVIEAKWLFGVDKDDIEVVVHPQSIIHSMVEFKDGSVKAQLGTPDMKGPIQYALTYPERLPSKEPKLNFHTLKDLTFEKPDMEVFPCLRLAFEALEQGGSSLTVLNAANEVLVNEFLKDKISFYKISDIIEQTIKVHDYISNPTLSDILEVDKWTREFVFKNVIN